MNIEKIKTRLESVLPLNVVIDMLDFSDFSENIYVSASAYMNRTYYSVCAYCRNAEDMQAFETAALKVFT